MKLQHAHLLYGSTTIPVLPTTSTPIPKEFDFASPEACAKSIFAIMGRAAGGHSIDACQLRINRERGTANLIGCGVHVFYRDDTLPPLTVDDALELVSRKVLETFHLGSVAPC